MLNPYLRTHIIRVASIFALLAAVIGSPMRPSRSYTEINRARSNRLGRILPLPVTKSAGLYATMVAERPVQVKAVVLENNEEELNGTTHPSGCFLHLPPDSSSPGSERDLAQFGRSRELHPLRC